MVAFIKLSFMDVMRAVHVFIFLFFASPLHALACGLALQSDRELCAAADRYAELKDEFLNRWNVDIETLSEYRALRFIARRDWEAALARNEWRPRMIYSPAPQTWDYWEQGDLVRKSLAMKISLKVGDLKDLHEAALIGRIMSWPARYLKGAGPGRIRHMRWQMPPSFSVMCKDGMDQKTFSHLSNFDIFDQRGEPLIRLMKRTERLPRAMGGGERLPYRCSDGVHFNASFNYLQSHKVKRELKRWLEAYNHLRLWLWQGDRSRENGIAEIAHLQRWLVSIHPFGDGNGRVSRWLQDNATNDLGLPYVASGDLQNDISTPAADYEHRFRAVILEQMQRLEECRNDWSATQGAPLSLRCQKI